MPEQKKVDTLKRGRPVWVDIVLVIAFILLINEVIGTIILSSYGPGVKALILGAISAIIVVFLVYIFTRKYKEGKLKDIWKSKITVGIIIILILTYTLLEAVFLWAFGEIGTRDIINRFIFIIIAGFLGYIVYRSAEGKKIAKPVKIIGWVMAIFSILLGIFGLIFSIFAFTNISTGLGIMILIVALILLFIGILAIRALTKKPNKNI